MRTFREFIKESELDNCNESLRNYDHEVAYLYRQDIPISYIKKEISSCHGPISFGEIYRSLRRSGLSPNRRARPFRSQVFGLYTSGIDINEISKITGYSTKQVKNIINLQNTEESPNDYISE